MLPDWSRVAERARMTIIRMMVDYQPHKGRLLYMLSRHLTGSVLEALADTPAVLVNGARQTGKSTLVQSEELAGQARQFSPLTTPAFWLLLSEIQTDSLPVLTLRSHS